LNIFNKYLRFSCWWHYKTATLLAFIYGIIYLANITFIDILPHVLVFLISVFGIASTGHFINDWTDIKIDTISGKENHVRKMNFKTKITVLLALIAVSFLPWLYLKYDKFILFLLISQFLLYVLYSVPPFRLKNKHIWGIIADSVYGHIIPIVVTVLLFSKYGNLNINIGLPVYIAALFLFTTKGFRNIILHQIDDRKKDRMANMKTFPLTFGSVFSINLINRLILTIELVSLFFITAFMSRYFNNFIWGLVLFFIFTYLKFNLWKYFILPPRQLKFKFLFFLNDFYEDWLPLIMLVYLITLSWTNILFLFLHLLLFPKSLFNFVKDVKLIFTR